MNEGMVGVQPIASAVDVAKYFLGLAIDDGDLVSNLKMQKIVYYAYAHTLVRHRQRLFGERIEAWANGPVVPELYQQLRKYGAKPIEPDFLVGSEQDDGDPEDLEEAFAEVAENIPPEVRETLNGVYERYMPMSAFELVARTHSERPWLVARRGLGPTDHGSTPIDDADVEAQFQDA